MALSLPSLDITNPQYHQSFLLEGNPENSDLYYDTLPPTIFSFDANDEQKYFCSSMLGLDQIDQMLVPNCYIFNQKQEEGSALINTFDQNYLNNSILSGIGDDMFVDDAQVFSYQITNQTASVVQSPKQNRVSQKHYIEVLILFII
jgi:hypothetical protein